MNNNSVIYKNKTIEYAIERKDVKNINLRVTPELKVIVSANNKVKKEDIHDFIQRKAKWIYNTLEKFKSTQGSTKKKKYVSGESLRYLGKQYMLKVIENSDNEVKYYRAKIFMYVDDKENLTLKEKLYEDWLNERATIVFEDILDQMYEKMKPYNVDYPKLFIKHMKTRWGSCNNQHGKININRDLIKAPKKLIEYVILHELIHLIYPNHSNDFYSLLGTLMPDFEERKETLDNDVIRQL